MDQGSHIAGENTSLGLVRVSFIVLSLCCISGGIFVGLAGVWQGFLFAACWIPMFLIGATGQPRKLFEPVASDSGLSQLVPSESEGFRSYDPLAHRLLAAMVLAGLAYILLAYLWPWLPHFAMGSAVLYLFLATAGNAYLWQCRIDPRRLFWSYVLYILITGTVLAAAGSRQALWAAALFYMDAWGLLYTGLTLHRMKARN